MILLFLIIFLFVSYVLVYSYNKSADDRDSSVFYLSCILVLFSFLDYGIKIDDIMSDFSIGEFLALCIGPFFLILLKKNRDQLFRHLSPLVIFLLIYSISFVYYPFYLSLLNEILDITVVLSCVIYGSYGYLYVIKRDINVKRDAVVIAYIVIIFSCAFFYGLLFFKTPSLFDIDYIYMNYCLFSIFIRLVNEIGYSMLVRRKREANLGHQVILVSNNFSNMLDSVVYREEHNILGHADSVDEIAEQRLVNNVQRIERTEFIRNKIYIVLIDSGLY